MVPFQFYRFCTQDAPFGAHFCSKMGLQLTLVILHWKHSCNSPTISTQHFKSSIPISISDMFLWLFITIWDPLVFKGHSKKKANHMHRVRDAQRLDHWNQQADDRYFHLSVFLQFIDLICRLKRTGRRSEYQCRPPIPQTSHNDYSAEHQSSWASIEQNISWAERRLTKTGWNHRQLKIVIIVSPWVQY